MKKFKLLAFLIFLSMSVSSWASERSKQLQTSSFIKTLISQQLEGLLQRDQYVIFLKLTLKAQHSALDTEDLQLPLGGVSLTMKDGEVASKQESMGDIGLIEKLDVQIGVRPDVSSSSYPLIEKSLKTGLFLDDSDSLSVYTLPELTTSNSTGQSKDFWSDTRLIIGLVVLVAAVFVFFLFQGLRKTFADSIDRLAQGLVSTPPTNTKATPLSQQESIESNYDHEFWSRHELQTLYMFAMDCLSTPQFYSAPFSLVFQLLPKELGSKLEEMLPKSYLESLALKQSANYSMAELKSTFLRYLLDYKRLSDSQIAKKMIIAEIDSLTTMLSQSSNKEVLALISFLTPLKRSHVLESLSTTRKLELVKEKADSSLAFEEKEKLFSKLEQTESPELQNFWALFAKSKLMEPKSFEDDELFFTQSTDISLDYNSALHSFDLFTTEDWSRINLRELALVFFGYSDEVRSRLLSMFSEKKAEWLDQYMETHRKAKLNFNSESVISARENITALVSTFEQFPSQQNSKLKLKVVDADEAA